jgi:small conductance mechanosensitive channel
MEIFTIGGFDLSSMAAARRIALSVALTLVRCAAVIVFGLIMNFAVKNMIKAAFAKMKKRTRAGNYDTIAAVLISVTRYAAFFLVTFNVLSLFGAPVESLLAVAGVGGIAVGFGARAIVEDFITGALILAEGQFAIGDDVKINSYEGVVESIGLRVTKIRSLDGHLHIMPNSVIRTVTNMSKSFARAVVEMPIAYEERAGRVIDIIKDELSDLRASMPDVLSDPVVHGVTDINAQNVTIRIVADCAAAKNGEIERLIRLRIKERFDREGVTPPFPRCVLRE